MLYFVSCFLLSAVWLYINNKNQIAVSSQRGRFCQQCVQRAIYHFHSQAKAKKQALKAGKEGKNVEDEQMMDAAETNNGLDNQGAEVDYQMHDDEPANKAGSHKTKLEVCLHLREVALL